MKQCGMYINGLGCKILHLTKIQTKHHFDPDKLQAEIKSRAQKGARERYDARYMHVDVPDGATGPNIYVVSFAHIDALQHIFAIIQEIEDEITDAKEQVRILGLLVPEGGGACGKR